MRVKKVFVTLCFVFLFLETAPFVCAQQTPKKATTTKTAAKKPIAKKKAVAKKSGNVFICDGVGGYFYHSRASCEILKKCKGRVLNVPKQQAVGQFRCKQCKKCY